MAVPDLFGDDIKLQPRGHGYCGDPGRGPEGMKCKHCEHCYSYQPSGNSRRGYFKCDLVKSPGGASTDIRLNMPACQFFEVEKNASD